MISKENKSKDVWDTIKFVKSKFSEFYKRYVVSVPDIDRREFGVGNWEKKIAVRHISFDSVDKLRTYLVEDTPLYISYSTAYYEFPSNRPMEAKNWQGADIVFDLDADLEGRRFPTEEQLEEVKNRTIRLIEEFLISDFGYSKKDLSINFSGGKGYHVHLNDDRVIQLSSDARRQIVDYIQGTMLDVNAFIYDKGKGRYIGPDTNQKGWRGRIAKYVYNHPEMFRPRKAKAKDFVDAWHRTLAHGNWSLVMDNKDKLKEVINKVSIKFSDDIDTQVTTDIHRLIRVPNTLHGGSSLCAVKFKVSALDKFDPLKHAVVFGGYGKTGIDGSEEIKIKIIEEVPKLVLNDQTFAPIPIGKTVRAPLYYAMYLICHKAAIVLNR